MNMLLVVLSASDRQVMCKRESEGEERGKEDEREGGRKEEKGREERVRELRMFYEYDNEDCNGIRNAFKSEKKQENFDIKVS